MERNEMAGQAVPYGHAAVDTDDTNFIMAKLYDEASDGKRKLATSGYPRASHRELDERTPKPWQPHHPHASVVPVPPGKITEQQRRI